MNGRFGRGAAGDLRRHGIGRLLRNSLSCEGKDKGE
jgi:hypothetical protein